MKNRLTLVFLIMSTFSVSGVAQQNPRSFSVSPNSLHLGFFADASMLNIKYERAMVPLKFGFVAAGAGVGVGMSGDSRSLLGYEGFEKERTFATLPHHITYNFGKAGHFLETGMGGTLFLGSPAQDYIAYPMLGYRFQNSGNIKSNFRVFLQLPFPENPGPEVFFIPFGFSLGTSF